MGLVALERVPVREHTELQSTDGQKIGEVTSGLLGPTVNEPIAIGYVTPAFAAVGTRVNAMVRGKAVPMEVRAMPSCPPTTTADKRPSAPPPGAERPATKRAKPLTLQIPKLFNCLRAPHDRQILQRPRWINAADANAAVVGITVHAQDALGDVVFVDLPKWARPFARAKWLAWSSR